MRKTPDQADHRPMGVGPTDISKKTTGLVGFLSWEEIWCQVVIVDMAALWTSTSV